MNEIFLFQTKDNDEIVNFWDPKVLQPFKNKNFFYKEFSSKEFHNKRIFYKDFFSQIPFIPINCMVIRHCKEIFFQGMSFQGTTLQGILFPRNFFPRNVVSKDFFKYIVSYFNQ